MKKTTTYPVIKPLFYLLIAMAAIACKKDTSAPAKTSPTSKFSFKIDGAAATTVDSANAILYTTTAGRQMDIYAYKGGAEILEFHFNPKTGVKTAGTVLGAGAFLTYMETPVKSYDSQTGTLNVTVCDTTGKKIEGDFSFIAKQYPYTGSTTKTITEGHMIVTKISKN